jgi:hypothetical protein
MHERFDTIVVVAADPTFRDASASTFHTFDGSTDLYTCKRLATMPYEHTPLAHDLHNNAKNFGLPCP